MSPNESEKESPSPSPSERNPTPTMQMSAATTFRRPGRLPVIAQFTKGSITQ